MKALHLMAISAAIAAMLIFAAAEADAQQRAAGGGPGSRSPVTAITSPVGKPGFHGGFGGVWIVEREVVIVEREVVREPPADCRRRRGPAPPRKPYVIGNSYASLPGGCMKLIEDGASYYYCGGEWYRQLGGGRERRRIGRWLGALRRTSELSRIWVRGSGRSARASLRLALHPASLGPPPR